MPNGQMGAVTVGGPRRRRSPYREMIETQAPYLPEMYRLREEKAEREREYGLRERGLALTEEQMRQNEKATRYANIIGAGTVGTQAYLGYKMGGAVAGGAGAGAGGAGGMTGAQLAMEGGTAGGAGAGASQVIPWLFAAYIGYKLWSAEKKRGAEYPGQPFFQSIGKSAGKGWENIKEKYF